MTSQNKYKKKFIFDVIEEEDEDKNVMKKNNNLKNMEENENNNFIGNKNENKLFIDSKYSNINGHTNHNNMNVNINNKEIGNDNLYKYNIFSKVNINNKSDRNLELLFDSKLKSKSTLNNKKFDSKWNHSSNNRNIETDIANKFSKESYLGKIIFNDMNREKPLFLPNIKSQNLISHKNVDLNKVILDPINDLKKIHFINNTNNKLITTNSNNFINDNTQATTLINYSTKKLTSSKINTIKSMNTDLTQFGGMGMGLISAGSTTNNNIIIPILTKTRPESNFNCGGGILKNFNENFENNNGKNRTIDSSKNIRPEKSRNFRKKICKSQEVQKRINSSMKNKDMIMLFPDIQRIMPTFHKIKIEKGMTNIKF